jgi:hypothetical protein
MQIDTSRFGPLEIEPSERLLFPSGLVAFEDCRHWILLADADNSLVGWLQSASRSDVAIPVVSPRRFKADYQIRINRTQLGPLHLRAVHEAVLLKRIDPANFRRQALATKTLVPTGNQLTGTSHRPPALYRFQVTPSDRNPT